MFVLHTRLAAITPLMQRDSATAQEKINAVTAGFGASTRIAASLLDFAHNHARAQLRRGSMARRGRPVRASAPTPAEKPAPKFKLDLPPMDVGSCCGGGAAQPEPAESVVDVAPTVVAAQSCCGG